MQGRKNKKKQPRLANNAEQTPTHSRVPAIAPTAAMSGPTRDINLTPTGAQASNMSPLTGQGNLLEEGSMFSRASTNTSATIPAEVIRDMVLEEMNDRGDGGDSDCEGEGRYC